MKERKGLVPLSFCSYIRSMETVLIFLGITIAALIIACILLLVQMVQLRKEVEHLYDIAEVRDQALHQLIENGREQEKLNNILIQAVSELQEGEIGKAMMFRQKMGEA
jgi:hypothetical protein